MDLIHHRKLEYLQDGACIVVSRNAVNGQRSAVHTLVDEHQLAARLAPVLVPARFEGQPNGPHLSLAGGQAIAGRVQIEMARPQTIRAVIAVIDAGKEVRARYQRMAVAAFEIAKGGRAVSHSSSRRCM